MQAAGPSAADAPPEADAGAEEPAETHHGVPPHVHGPARPPAELLAAAQEAAAAVRTHLIWVDLSFKVLNTAVCCVFLLPPPAERLTAA